MAKFVIQRILIIPLLLLLILIIPLLLLLVNFLGFTYAHYARPIRAARTPYVRAEEPEPLIPSYVNYLKTLFNLDFDMEFVTPITARSNTPTTLGETLKSAALRMANRFFYCRISNAQLLYR
jgi:ABC-type dipeptide/oligopeptide/nickel transport system permease component